MFKKIVKVLFCSFLLGILVSQHTRSHQISTDSERIASLKDKDAFFWETDAHRAAWDRVLEHCYPVRTGTPLNKLCLTSLGDYFANEPIWRYNHLYIYGVDGWLPLFYRGLIVRRSHTAADFLNTNVPFWRDIIDEDAQSRQEQFLKVARDRKYEEIARENNVGMQEDLADQCAIRELFKYAAYLNACYDAKHRLAILHRVLDHGSSSDSAKNLFEDNLRLLDEHVRDEELKSALKRKMAKGYLHASWINSQCNEHGFVLKPGITIGSDTSTEKRLHWEDNFEDYFGFLYQTHKFLMTVAIKGGDDWAIRSGHLATYIVAEFSDDLMQRYPLLMHRVIGENAMGSGYGIHLTLEELAQHRAKAYLLLVDEAGEEFARSQYDPDLLVEEIKHVESGGSLKSPPSRTQIADYWNASYRRRHQQLLLEEAKTELTQ